MKPWGQRLMASAWPAFLAAGVLEMLVFALVDPGELHWGGQPLDLSPRAVYSLAFLAFWAVVAASGMITAVLMASAEDINREGSR